RRLGIEPVLLAEARLATLRRRRRDLARELADRHAELHGAAHAVALPERHLPGLAGRGDDEHAIVRDVRHTPRRRTEEEHLADVRLEDHLLVELAAPDGAVALGGVEEHAVEAAVGDRAAARDGEPLRALPRDERSADAVPRHARAQLGELV